MNSLIPNGLEILNAFLLSIFIMTPEEAYSIKLISDVKLNNEGDLLHVETWIEKKEYRSAIFLNKRKIIEGKVSLPRFNGEYLYYVKEVKGQKNKKEACLFRKSPYGEEEKLLCLGKISDYTFHNKGILILGEDKVNKNKPFEATKLKYRFDSRGLLRTRQSLYLFSTKLEKIISGDFDVTGVATNGKRVVISATKENDDIGLSDVYEVYLSNGEMRRITQGEGIVNALAMNEKGQIAYLGHRKGRAPWAVEEIILPEEANNPTILFIHGGPHAAYGYGYFIEFQFFASNGFNIIYCNPRGSQGYGEDFAKACVGDWGGKDMQDIINFTKKVIEKYNLKGKLGVTGGSYGGYMTNWIITQTDMFSAAIAERSISNLVSMCGTSDIGFWFNAIEAGIDDPWKQENIEKLMRMSPIYYVKNAKTPTMLIHGEEDYRCPIEQAEQFFMALKMNGVPTVLERYPGDSHEHARRGKPKNMIDRLYKKIWWFTKYLK
jgi:Dipeptidyl aminopeptidases/acylaminoacyl-peptidases